MPEFQISFQMFDKQKTRAPRRTPGNVLRKLMKDNELKAYAIYFEHVSNKIVTCNKCFPIKFQQKLYQYIMLTLSPDTARLN